MDLLLLLLIVAVFILPSFFMMRTQRRRQAELQSMQAALASGDRVVTVSGIHGTIVGVRDAQIDVELAPGVVVVMDRIAVLRQEGETGAAAGAEAGTDAGTAAVGPESTYDASTVDRAEYRHPENAPESRPESHPENFPEERRNDGGHPENR